jgi:hypothetical protein
MTVELEERRLGALRWIVLSGPGIEAFGALGRHPGTEIRAVVGEWDDLVRLRQHVAAPRAASGRPPVTAVWKPGFLPSTTFTVSGTSLVWAIDHLPAASPAAGRAGPSRRGAGHPGCLRPPRPPDRPLTASPAGGRRAPPVSGAGWSS